MFDLFVDDDEVPIVGGKRGQKETLHYPEMDYQWTMKKATVELVFKISIDDQRHAEMATGAFSISAPPPPPPHDP